MVMSLGSYASRVVATKVVAIDGTGDFTDIQSAIDALPAGGGVVYIKEGIYNLTSGLTVTSNNISLIGSGRSTIIEASGIGMGATALSFTTANYCIVDMIYFDIEEDSVTAISATDINNLIVSNCYFYRMNYGLYLNNCTACSIYSNYLSTGTLHGILALGTSSGNSFQNNYITLCADGLRSDGSGNVIIGNTCYNNTSVGIDIRSSPETTVEGNVCKSNLYGIAIFGCNYCSVVGNICNENGDDGIWFETGADYCTVSANQCISNGSRGINIIATCDNNTFTGNVAVLNTTAQITDLGAGNVFCCNITA